MHIRTFAKLAGVSIATISRAFDPKGAVKAETRKRIHDLAAQHGFTPNIHARRMSSRQSGILGIFYEFSAEPIFDYYQMELAQQIALEVARAGYTTQLELSSANEQQSRLRQLVENRALDGFILVGENEANTRAFLRSFPAFPIVVISTTAWQDSSTTGLVHLDLSPGIERALADLRQGHHTEIGYIRGMADSTKLETYRSFMDREGMTVREEWISTPSRSLAEGGRKAVELARLGCTAILCATDILALGALHSLTAAGFNVPNDVSIVGIDDLAFASSLTPPLSSIGVPRGQLAREAVESVTEIIRGSRAQEAPSRRLVTVEATYIPRESTRALPLPGETGGSVPISSRSRNLNNEWTK